MPKTSNFDLYSDKFEDYFRENKIIPSFEKMKDILWVSSKNTVHNFMKKMEEDGLVEKIDWSYFPTQKMTAIPVYSSVRAGFASSADDASKDYLNLETYIMEHPNSSVLVTVKGDSMINASILEGDMAVVDKWKNANIWDIVIAEVDWNFTLKYLMKDNQERFYLKAWNDNYPDIYPDNEMNIFGVLVSVVRKIR